MVLWKSLFALGVSLVFNRSLGLCLSPSDIPSDTPIASLISSAKSNLAQGKSNDALTYFDVAISRDPKNYLTIFQRGATYLSLGKNAQASEDFDKVLSIKPDFEGALLQRAKINSRAGDWKAAVKDYHTAGKTDSAELQELEEAHGAATLASDAEKAQDWETCVSHAGIAIVVASTSLSLRQLRARCRLERGEVLEAVSDLQHVLQISPQSIDPHLQISAMLFYAVGDTARGLAQVHKCLHSDPDSRPCSKLRRAEKKVDKLLKKVAALEEKRQFNSAVKLLVTSGEDQGLIDLVKEDFKDGQEAGIIHPNVLNELYITLIEKVCEFYGEMNNKRKARPYCDETLTLNPHSLPGLLSHAQTQLDADEYEPAIHTLSEAKEHHPDAESQINPLLQNAHTLLKRSKTKDYYKVLAVDREADPRTIKSAYRAMTRKFHPDKAHAMGITKEVAEKKMAAVNEAYEVLGNPELRERFDMGDDPNDQEHQGSPFQGSPFGAGPGGQQFFFRSGAGSGGGFQFAQGGFHFG